MEIVIFIVGFIFASLGAGVIWDFNKFKQSATPSSGQIVGYAVRRSRTKNSGVSETYAPVVQYEAQGQQHQFTASVSSSHVRHQIGDVVPILIHRRDPSQARLNSPLSKILGGLFIFIGTAAMAAFISAFDMNLLSLGIVVGVIALLIVKLFSVLQRHHIYSFSAIKNSIEKIKQTSMTGNSLQREHVITDPEVFKRHVKRRNSMPIWLLTIFLIVGIGVIVGGIFLGEKRIDFLQTALIAEGNVVSFNSKTSTSDGHTTTTYYPIVKYMPPNQIQPITFEHDVGSNPPSYHRGEVVKVLYSPNNPYEAIIDEGWMNYFAPVLMLIIGSVFILLSGSLLIKNRKSKTAQQYLKLDF